MHENKPNVGLRLRAFRERQGLSLRALAERCGLSINAISRIERGENSPTVSSLNRLSSALSVPITDFFVEREGTSTVFVKRGLGERHSKNGLIAEHLGKGLPWQQLEPFMISMEPGTRSTSGAVSHPGQEFVLCLSGEVLYFINEMSFPLRAGDSLLFEAMQPHWWENQSTEPATLLLVFQAAQDNSLARQCHQTG